MVRIYLALGLYLVTLVAAFGLRTLTQRRQYGDGGWRFHMASPRAAVIHVLIGLTVVLLSVAPVVAAIEGEPYEPAGLTVLGESGGALAALAYGAGLLLSSAGAGLIVVAQRQMGASWRIGVDPGETTELVADGLFRWVRNPIFSGMALLGVGQALLVPNALSIAAVIAGTVGLQLQVRWIEEPYLVATHGDAYLHWASRVGRFVPGLGRLAPR
jgi:protein-S-isoprenylcysteine O-methyltransferase Ste14